MEILSAIGFNATDPLKKVFQESLRKADNGDGILTKDEYEKATKTVIDSDEFKSLSAENKKSFTEKLKPDAIWGQQGAASVINYDGNKLQIEYYEEALKDGKKDKDSNPIVTKAQLEYARNNGFGDMNGDEKITGLELAVADLDGKKGRGAKDGDLNGDGKVNKEDRGVSLGSSSQSNKGLDTGKLMAFIDELIKIWAPRAAGNTSAAPANDISTALKKIMEAAKTRTITPTP
jgi:hypothetical protein